MPLLLALLFALAAFPALAADEHVQAALVSERDALVPGTTAWLGVRLTHAPHWHTYWVNPGDSGLATKLAWQLPPGFSAGEIAWPAPQRIAVGDLYNFGYEGDMVLPVPVEVPSAAAPGSIAHLALTAKWLVCHEQCIPGKADLAIDLPVRASAGKSKSVALWAATRAVLPVPATWSGNAQLQGDELEVALRGPDAPIADAFVVERKLVNYTPPRIARRGAVWTLKFAKSDYYVSAPAGVDLIVRSGAQTHSVNVPFSSATP